MYAKYILSALAALSTGTSALPFNPNLERRAYSPDISTPLSQVNPTYTKQQLNDIKLAPTMVERLKLIRGYSNTDKYFKFDFTPKGFTSNAGDGQGGQGFLADVQNYPILSGTGISMAIGYLGPCGLDSMHVHNRATEFLILVNGTSLKTGFVQEDGFYEPVVTNLGLYQGTIRPQGAVHYEFNDNCEPAVFVTGLSNEDPGVSRTAEAFFAENPALVKADLGYPDFLAKQNLGNFAKSIPAAFGLGAQECLSRCGLKYNATEH